MLKKIKKQPVRFFKMSSIGNTKMKMWNVLSAVSFRWIFVFIPVVLTVGCTVCSTTSKDSASEAPEQPSALPCPVTQTMCTMEYAPVRCFLKQGQDEIAAVDAENSCRGKLLLNEKWCKLSNDASNQGKKPHPVVECRPNAD
jgi:hypothetical protein